MGMPLLPLKPMAQLQATAVLIETTRATLNNRRRVKFVLKDIEFIRSALFFNILRPLHK
jgi:hypothetical protein